MVNISNTIRQSNIPGAKELFVIRDIQANQGADDILPTIENWYYNIPKEGESGGRSPIYLLTGWG